MPIKTSHPASPRDEAQVEAPPLGKSRFSMIDVGEKPASKRRAIARGTLTMGQEAFDKLKQGTLPKGDALGLAEIAGINAAKQTANLLPMCHPLPLDFVKLGWELHDDTCEVVIRCEASVVAKTGIEMEVLAGVNGALLCLYDLIKGTDPALTMSGVRLEIKEGGKKGLWIHPDASEEWQNLGQQYAHFKTSAAILVLSDRASKGDYEDLAGPILQQLLKARGVGDIHYQVIPDDKEILKKALNDLTQNGIGLVLTSGGTGPALRDITPDVVEKLADKVLSGIGEALRQHGKQFTKTTWLSRSIGARIKNTLVITLPGNPKAIAESFPVLDDVVPTILKLIKKEQA